jgi:hypothetical protein
MYDGGGYVVDFNKSMTVSNFTSAYTQMMHANWIQTQSRTLFINAVMYSPAYDVWINVVIVSPTQLFEFTLTNYVITTQLTAEVFSPSLFGHRSDRVAAQALDIIRLVLSLHLVYEYVMTVRSSRKHAYSTLGVMDCTTFVLILTCFSMSYTLREDDEALIDNDEFFDAEFLSYNYKVCMILNAIVILFLILRLVFCNRLSRSVYTHLYTVDKASKNAFALLLFLLPLIIGFVILTMNIYGPTFKNFRSFDQALLRILLLTSGYGSVLKMFLNFREWTVVLWLIYFFGIVFFLMSAFMGIYMDAYRRVKMLSGKDDENLPPADRLMWKNWAKASLPNFMFRG